MPSAPPVSVITEIEEPILGELFSVDRLEQHAESLAAAQAISTDSEGGKPLIPRVAENGRLLLEYYRATARAIQRDEAITPGAQWLVENFYIVEEQLREIRDHLPAGFYRKLPKLASGPLEGYPRVYGVAWAYVAHTDSRFDPESLRRFVTAYQRVQPLSIGELWAVAITLRIVLIENLRRLSARMVLSRDERSEADILADRLLGTGGQSLVSPAAVLRQFEKKPLDRAFAVQLIQRLRDLDPKVGPILLWLDERLASQGTSADEIVRAEHAQQAATSVTVRNIITSMRLTSAFDWQVFFENVSLVDQVLRDGSDFAAMDFATRDSYRHAIEDLAHGSRLSEVEVTERAVGRAQKAASAASFNNGHREERLSDPGYYLLSHGRLAFEREIGFHVPWRRWLLRLYVRAAAPGYLGTIAIFTALILSLFLVRSWELGASKLDLVLLGLMAAIPASELAMALINRGVTDLLGPRPLARLEIHAIPENLRTIVVVPTLLTSLEDIDEQVERLEIHFLANSDGHLRFALLSDWCDAATETLPNDEDLLAAAIGGIDNLNKRHGPAPGGGNRFFVFHRKRVWNESEGKWMGWERKRGKLHELNLLLRGSDNTTFVTAPGPEPPIPDVRYVITLDADTRLPRDAAAKLVGTIAHPLNQPLFSAEQGRVVDGYGIVQPRITPSLPVDGQGSRFQRIFSGPSGIDPYASAVSDVYQDLFREGSYTGKGIYDLDVFEEALTGKVPENMMLSHDLFEGIFARAALVSDIELFDEFPPHYETAAARLHRWARGDWQLLPWIFGKGAKTKDGAKFKIPVIGRWKMLDNLRRSLVPICMFLTLLVGWLLPRISPWLWTRFILAAVAIPALIPFLAGINIHWGGISKRSHLRGLASDLTLGLSQTALTIVFLSFQAWLMADAIGRTLVRSFFTHKHMLEWVTAAQAKHRVDLNLANIFRRMGGGVLLALAACAAVWFGHRSALFAAVPFVILWVTAPAVAYWISLPPKPSGKDAELSATEIQSLRVASRRTWRFFETFVTAEDRFLPPDNFQEDPKPVVAHRTSPTNIGLYLLSTLAGRTFGWLGTQDALGRFEATFGTMGKLDMFRGHLYNWYDTRDLHPLEPKYISSVDSGNLAGHLLTLAHGCRQLIEKPSLGPSMFAGMEDAIFLLREALDKLANTPRIHSVTQKQLNNALDVLAASVRSIPVHPPRFAAKIIEISGRAQTVADMARALAQEVGDSANSDVLAWCQAIETSAAGYLRDATVQLPWLRLGPRGTAAIVDARTAKAPEWMAIEQFFPDEPTLADAPDRFEGAIRELTALQRGTPPRTGFGDSGSQKEPALSIDSLIQAIQQSSAEAVSLERRLRAIAQRSNEMFAAMEFGFLFDNTRKLLSIGYRATDGQLDSNCYDLLASEARLASFVAIAKGDVPSSHWFRLGRPLTPVGRGSALISWSGSMFEYLMPALVMHSPANSLLAQTYRQVVIRQIEYGNERAVPWGISESAYAARDINFTYQYSSFGVPGLGLKRGLSEDLVIAPYATALAAMVAAPAALENLERLTKAGARGTYGFYEALDYTSSRLPEGQDVAIVRAYMAHHQGMFLISLANALQDGAMCSLFHASPIVQATELLLQERTPRDVLVARPRAEEVSAASQLRELVAPTVREFRTAHDATPRTQLLSNGRYGVMLTSAGSGYSRWRDIAITRWREDATRDCWGTYIYLRDEQTGSVWSTGYQPSGIEPDSYEASFDEDHAEITRRDRSLTTALEVVVSSEDDAEMRRVSITNSGLRARNIQVTSFAELSLTTQAADVAAPAFANLFVETEFVADMQALLATRRRRSDDETPVWVAHVLVVEGELNGDLQYETDRARFIGRGRSARNPVSVVDGRPLSGTVGSVLDPMIGLRRTLHIPPGHTAHLTFSILAAATRDEVVNLTDKYRDPSTFERTRTLAWTRAQVQLRHLGISAEEADLFQRLANAVIYSDPNMRPGSEILSATPLDRSVLWAQGISGDLPIVIARIDDPDDVDMIQQLLRAHEYWRMKQLSADVVIINEKASSYMQDLQGSLESLVRGSQLRLSPDTGNASGKIFLLRADLLTPQARAQLQAVARVVLLSRRGTLSDQIVRSQHEKNFAPPTIRPARAAAAGSQAVTAPLPTAQFFNGLGGFIDNGREYEVVLTEGLRTPEPWVNVIANENFGFLVSESGSGFTWSVNSHENQITPWSNDHVIDPPAEAIYLRDESTGEVWTPTALPIRQEDATYVTRHGQGYTRFTHASHGISADLVQFVPLNDSIKISKLTLQNDSARVRRISVTAYVEWLLGSSRAGSAPYIITEADLRTGAILARSAWQGEFGGRVSFADIGVRPNSFTCDRAEFLGRNGTPELPAGLESGRPLSGKTGAALDPCAALQTFVELRPGARVEIPIFLGQAESKDKALELLARYRTANIDNALVEVKRQWDDIVGTVQVSTPDPGMDLLLNRWLLYQTLSCRVWARAAFYQLSGAFGFRDQLQDVLALTVAKRNVTREQILLAASRQFVEGDVQHWWHPPSGRGIRTRISDDLLWLPYVVIQFIEASGDTAILEEVVPFIEGPVLQERQNESYFEPRVSETQATLFEHCARALDRSLQLGAHGLPLMGTGDWNDGMNRVGQDGKGESVWLAWFLHTVLWEFAKVADARGERKRAETWRVHVSALKAALERTGWDGAWYRRAFYDDGTPLGSSTNTECRIDSIAQSWGIMSGAAESARGTQAMASVDQNLIRRPDGLVLLLTPPFDHTDHDPGYIKGYVPGIRENGGQYVHAAVWTLIAFAALGDGDKASEIFRMLNPINKSNSRASAQRYKVEPYVMAGDVYGEAPHAGRGGWTWYTGSAGWFYRAGLEWILGFRVRGMALTIDPCIPRDWTNYSVKFRYHSSTYDIRVENPSRVARGVALTELDGKVLSGSISIPLVDDGATHVIRVVLG
jgi:cyclic beta-1,2-glucan synthetase